MRESIKIDVKLNESELKKVNEKIDDMLELWGIELEGAVKKLTPVDTGRLRNSVTHATKKDEGNAFTYSDNQGKSYLDHFGQGIKERTVAVGTNVEYAPAVEFNDQTRHATGQAHYIRDGVLSSKDALEAIARKISKS